MSGHNESMSRVAIQLGASTSASLNEIKKRSRPTHVKRHRAHALEEESASESDDGHEQPVRHELITTYGDDGEEEFGDRGHQLKRQKQDDRKTASSPRHGHDLTTDDRSEGREASPDTQDKPVKWGLTINMKGTGSRRDRREMKRGGHRKKSEEREPSTNGEQGKSLDDQALDALIGSESSKKSKHKISGANNPDGEPRPEDYQAVPIDDFGATLLKSYGWDGQMRGKVKEVVKHANLTGLGAKDAKGAEDLGAWNQKTSKDSRPVRLEDYHREQNKKRQRLEDRHRDSYKVERARERDRERGR